MTRSVSRRAARKLTVRCPVSAETFRLLVMGQADAAERDVTLGKMLALIRGDNPLGDFGIYTGVVEIGLGFESFVPGARAKPAQGEAGGVSMVPTVTLTTYISHDAREEPVTIALAQLIALHPWEIPVIEFAPVELLGRATSRLPMREKPDAGVGRTATW